MHWQQEGDGFEGKVLLDAFGRFSCGFERIPSLRWAQLVTGLTGGGHRSGWSRLACANVGNQSNRCSGPV
jgi:hypothetical protein